jgi:hypothetical protein
MRKIYHHSKQQPYQDARAGLMDIVELHRLSHQYMKVLKSRPQEGVDNN